MIRLLLIDDHTSFRGALAFMLGREEDIDIVGEAGNPGEAQAVLERYPVDVALVDLDLNGEDGTTLIKTMHAHYPDAAAIVLTANQRAESRAMAVAAGAVGVLLKTSSVSEVLAAVRMAAAGEPLMKSAEIVELFRSAAAYEALTTDGERALQTLTAREADVLRALTAGLDNQAIADRLFVSHETVRSHIVRILRKLGVESRLQAALFALRHGFVNPDDLH